MYRVTPFFFVVLAWMYAGGAVMGQTTVVLEPDRDNTLYEIVDGSLSNGAGEWMFAGQTLFEPTVSRRALVHFDVAGAVPAGSTILSASLTLHLSRVSLGNPGDTNADLKRVTTDWGEGTSNAGSPGGGGTTSTTNDATWIHAKYTSDLWTNVGGDFVAGTSASLLVNNVGFYTWGSTATMVADVQGWLDTPTVNAGWILVGDEAIPGSAKRFDTRENVTPANRPMLTIQYDPPLPVELVEFEATSNGKQVTLAWQTASEINNIGWDVEQKRSGAFSAIGFVPSRGHEGAYVYRAVTVEPGLHTFRLKQIDADGSTHYSSEVEVFVDAETPVFVSNVYPHPFDVSTSFTVMARETQDLRVAVHDLTGRKVADLFDGVANAYERVELTIDGSNLSAGVYAIRTVTGSQVTTRFAVVAR